LQGSGITYHGEHEHHNTRDACVRGADNATRYQAVLKHGERVLSP
jgi:hypothetical protein